MSFYEVAGRRYANAVEALSGYTFGADIWVVNPTDPTSTGTELSHSDLIDAANHELAARDDGPVGAPP